MTKVRNMPTPDGREMGEQLARLCDDAEPKARLRIPDLPPRCPSCAFRAGPHVANGSPTTVMDALKCVIEGVPFHCHQPDRQGHLCSGWSMMQLAKEAPDFGVANWRFSDELGDCSESQHQLEPRDMKTIGAR